LLVSCDVDVDSREFSLHTEQNGVCHNCNVIHGEVIVLGVAQSLVFLFLLAIITLGFTPFFGP